MSDTKCRQPPPDPPSLNNTYEQHLPVRAIALAESTVPHVRQPE